MSLQTFVPLTLRDGFSIDPFFRDSWSDFDNLQRAMSTRFGESDNWLFPRRMMSPVIKDDFFRDVGLFQEQDDQVIRITDNDKKYELAIDTQGYKPDDIKVTVEKNVMTVEAKHEEKDEGKFVSRQFKRSYTLPKECECEKTHSNLSSDGVLVISAPKKAKE